MPKGGVWRGGGGDGGHAPLEAHGVEGEEGEVDDVTEHGVVGGDQPPLLHQHPAAYHQGELYQTGRISWIFKSYLADFLELSESINVPGL